MDFVQIQALFAPRCRVSRKKSNAELREMGKNTPFSLNVHTPRSLSKKSKARAGRDTRA
jgi:hypothetical protein